MTWATAKAAIVTGLALSGIKRVYANPPGAIQDTPCFIIFPPPVENAVKMGARWREYLVPIQCFVSDQDKDAAAASIDAFRELLIPAFDANVSLGGGATMAYVKSVSGGLGLQYPAATGPIFAGFEATIFVEIKEGVSFSG